LNSGLVGVVASGSDADRLEPGFPDLLEILSLEREAHSPRSGVEGVPRLIPASICSLERLVGPREAPG